MADQSTRDANFATTLMVASSDGLRTPVALWADKITHRLLVDVGTITTTSASVGATGAAVPTSADYVAGNKVGNLVGLLIGQQTMANSLAVVLASDQSTLPVSLATLPALVAGSAIIGKVTTDQTTHGTTDLVAADITKIGGAALTIGQQLAAASIPVILPSATISTLTPPSNTGYALDASLSTVNTSVNTLLKPASTLTAVTTVATLTNQSQEGGVAISLNAGAVDTGTRRVVQANGAGKTIVSVGGSVSASGNNTLVAAGTNRLKVFAFSLSTLSTSSVLCIFQSGASGTELWRVVLQAGTGVSTGANLAISPPAWLFATASATLLNLNISSANAVNWSVSYFDEA